MFDVVLYYNNHVLVRGTVSHWHLFRTDILSRRTRMAEGNRDILHFYAKDVRIIRSRARRV